MKKKIRLCYVFFFDIQNLMAFIDIFWFYFYAGYNETA